MKADKVKKTAAALIFALIVTALDLFVHWESIAASHGAALITALAIGILCFFRPLSERAKNSGNRYFHDLFSAFEWKIGDRIFFAAVFVTFVILYLPAYLALFPGTLGYDTPIQLAMFFGEQPMTAGNPVAHTLLLGALVKLGLLVYGRAQAGFALYILIQFGVVAFAVADSFLFLKRRRTPVLPMILGFLWIALSSEMKALTFNATKDILFGAFLLIFMVSLADYLISSETEHNKSKTIGLFVAAFLICLFRNPCVIILLILCVACAVFRVKKKGLYIALLSAVCASLIFSKICSAVFSIEPAGRTVPAFVPAQQLGLTASYAADPATETSVNLTEEELAQICELIPEQVVRGERHEFSADTYFATFREERYKENPAFYNGLWLKIGMKNKGIYFHAYRNLVKPYFDAAYNPYRELVFDYSFPELDHRGIERRSFYPSLYERLYSDVVEKDRYFFVFQPGFGIFLGILLIIDALLRKRWRMFLSIFPLIVYFAGWLIGPVALLRYLYPLMISIPFLFGLIFQPVEE